jgi:hypothetical protein
MATYRRMDTVLEVILGRNARGGQVLRYVCHLLSRRSFVCAPMFTTCVLFTDALLIVMPACEFTRPLVLVLSRVCEVPPRLQVKSRYLINPLALEWASG